MARGFGDEIAVLDGLDFGGLEASPKSASDGRLGRDRATVGQYSQPLAHNVTRRTDVLDPSEGANYSGGSAYARGIPLGPSTWGLAGAFADQDLMNYSKLTTVLPPRKGVIDPSGGANYSGGSNYGPGMPLVTSGDAGLAASLIRGGYGKAGLGRAAPLIRGGYGSAGLGRAGYETYDDFEGVPLSALDQAFGSSITIEDGRIGRTPATGHEYARQINSGYQVRTDVLDPSSGANYSGGSSYARGIPLGPSTWGLAELSLIDALDGLGDTPFKKRLHALQRTAFQRVAGKDKLKRLQAKAEKIRKAYNSMPPDKKAKAQQKLALLSKAIGRIRTIRRNVLQSAPAAA